LRRQPGTDEIPVPGIAPNPIPGITQRLVLQPFAVQPGLAAVGNQKFTTTGDEMRHRMPSPDMAVQPKTAGHRMDHPLATVLKLTPPERRRRVRYWQPMSPSTVAGACAVVAPPTKIAHVSGNDCGWVAVADQPDADAFVMFTTTPGERW
jgi:hypothetical protein